MQGGARSRGTGPQAQVVRESSVAIRKVLIWGLTRAFYETSDLLLTIGFSNGRVRLRMDSGLSGREGVAVCPNMGALAECSAWRS